MPKIISRDGELVTVDLENGSEPEVMTTNSYNLFFGEEPLEDNTTFEAESGWQPKPTGGAIPDLDLSGPSEITFSQPQTEAPIYSGAGGVTISPSHSIPDPSFIPAPELSGLQPGGTPPTTYRQPSIQTIPQAADNDVWSHPEHKGDAPNPDWYAEWMQSGQSEPFPTTYRQPSIQTIPPPATNVFSDIEKPHEPPPPAATPDGADQYDANGLPISGNSQTGPQPGRQPVAAPAARPENLVAKPPAQLPPPNVDGLPNQNIGVTEGKGAQAKDVPAPQGAGATEEEVGSMYAPPPQPAASPQAAQPTTGTAGGTLVTPPAQSGLDLRGLGKTLRETPIGKSLEGLYDLAPLGKNLPPTTPSAPADTSDLQGVAPKPATDTGAVTFDYTPPVEGWENMKPSPTGAFHYYDGKARDGRTHLGVDIAMPEGTAIRAAADGKVTRVVDYEDGDGGGIRVQIMHDDGRSGTYSMHLSRADVKLHDKVKAGQVIGLSGSTGNAGDFEHLHQQVSVDGKWVDPMAFYSGQEIQGTAQGTARPRDAIEDFRLTTNSLFEEERSIQERINTLEQTKSQEMRSLYETQSKRYGSMLKEHQQREVERQKLQAQYHAKAEEAVERVRNMRVNPNQVWEDAGAARSFGAMIGIAMGEMIALKFKRPNNALAIVDNIIARNIDAQKANINNAQWEAGQVQNLYQQNMQLFQNERMAEAATTSQFLEIAKMEANLQLSRLSDPVAQEQGKQLLLGIDKRQLASDMKFYEVAEAKAAAEVKGKWDRYVKERELGQGDAKIAVDLLKERNAAADRGRGKSDPVGGEAVIYDINEPKGVIGRVMEQDRDRVVNIGVDAQTKKPINLLTYDKDSATTLRPAATGARDFVRVAQELSTLIEEHGWEPTNKNWTSGPGARMLELRAELIASYNKAKLGGVVREGDIEFIGGNILGPDPTSFQLGAGTKGYLDAAAGQMESSYNGWLHGAGYAGPPVALRTDRDQGDLPDTHNKRVSQLEELQQGDAATINTTSESLIKEFRGDMEAIETRASKSYGAGQAEAIQKDSASLQQEIQNAIDAMDKGTPRIDNKEERDRLTIKRSTLQSFLDRLTKLSAGVPGEATKRQEEALRRGRTAYPTAGGPK